MKRHMKDSNSLNIILQDIEQDDLDLFTCAAQRTTLPTLCTTRWLSRVVHSLRVPFGCMQSLMLLGFMILELWRRHNDTHILPVFVNYLILAFNVFKQYLFYFSFAESSEDMLRGFKKCKHCCCYSSYILQSH